MTDSNDQPNKKTTTTTATTKIIKWYRVTHTDKIGAEMVTVTVMAAQN